MIWYTLDIVSIALTLHALLSLSLMLHAWETPERLADNGVMASWSPPKYSFTVLLPARHEEAVIYETVRQVWSAHYPKELLQVLVICHADDRGTIAEARRAIKEIASPNVSLVTFSDTPINKPHGLNVGLQDAKHDVVTVFDAEDDISPEIFNVINSRYRQEKLGLGVIQAGVQLVNFRDHWFGLHNCLEYFFWFKSRLHFHAATGMIPLGGNTVFIPRAQLECVDGWSETCLTEDAEIGIRLSLLGQPIRTIYDPRYATREETPQSIGEFVRQRTRWHQGFMQTLRIGAWRRLPRRRQRWLAIYTLAYPMLQAVFLLLLPIDLAVAIWFHPPTLGAMVTFLPLYVLLLQLLALIVGAHEFAKEYEFKLPWHVLLLTAITYLPFLLIQAISSLRAVVREIQGNQEWEKTVHAGAHRQAPVDSSSAA